MALLPMGAALAAGSASMNLDPSLVTAVVGDRFTVTINVDPGGEQIDTARAFLTFTPGVLVAENMELGSLMSRAAPGSAIDNGAGTVSFGGFTLEGPVTQKGVFGTVTFRVAQSGSASVNLLGSSRMIAGGEEKYGGATDTVSVNAAAKSEKISGVAFVTVTSTTHPDETAWYNATEATVNWKAEEDGSKVTAFYTAFDQNSDTDPTAPTSPTSQTVSITEDGLWYFHLKAKQGDGRTSNIAHFKIQKDAAPPNQIAVELSRFQIEEDEGTELTFGTTDEASGIARYEVSVNDGPFVPAESPLALDGFEPGTYLVEVKATDRAGNSIYGMNTLRVYEDGTFPQQTTIVSEEAVQIAAKEDSKKLLITSTLVLVAILAIILTILKRRKK